MPTYSESVDVFLDSSVFCQIGRRCPSGKSLDQTTGEYGISHVSKKFCSKKLPFTQEKLIDYFSENSPLPATLNNSVIVGGGNRYCLSNSWLGKLLVGQALKTQLDS